MKSLKEYQNNKFWNKYISELRNKPVKPGSERWYVMHVEQYVKSIPDRKLLDHKVENLSQYLTILGCKEGIKEWIFIQHIEALQILFCKVMKVNWCDQIDWDFWYVSAKQLKVTHPTIAREIISCPEDQKSGISNINNYSISIIKQSHISIFKRLVTEIRRRNYSIRTEQTYSQWIARYISFHQNKDPLLLGAKDVALYLEYLATQRNVSSNTQNQALSALVFLYHKTLNKELGELGDFSRAKKPKTLPVVLTRREIKNLLQSMSGINLLMASLLYGTGMRLMECITLRVKDIDFEYKQIHVRRGKGQKDRIVPLPESLIEFLIIQLKKSKKQHEKDLHEGGGDVYLPDALSRKYPNAAKEWMWQYVFQSGRLSVDPRSKLVRRHHLHESGLQRNIKKAARKAGINKPVKCHTLRHYADNLIMPSKIRLSK